MMLEHAADALQKVGEFDTHDRDVSRLDARVHPPLAVLAPEFDQQVRYAPGIVIALYRLQPIRKRLENFRTQRQMLQFESSLQIGVSGKPFDSAIGFEKRVARP